MQNLLFSNVFLNAPLSLIVLLFSVLAVAAVYDFKTFTIPHIFTYLVIGIFVVSAILIGLSLPALSWHILSAIITFAAALILFVFGLMGGGDVKIFGAIGLWVLPAGTLGLIFCVTISGLLLSVLYLASNMMAQKPEGANHLSISDRYDAAKSTRIAYGPAISIGTLIYFLNSTQIT